MTVCELRVSELVSWELSKGQSHLNAELGVQNVGPMSGKGRGSGVEGKQSHFNAEREMKNVAVAD
jgi:hypothetical protein